MDPHLISLILRRRHLLRYICTSIIIIVIVTYIVKHINIGLASQLDLHGDISKRTRVNHVVFLKVHKAAGTTIMNLLMRYGMSHNLKVMVPQINNVFSQRDILRSTQILHYADNDIYDIMCCHAIYNKNAISPYVPKDTVYVGIVRHPLPNFLSAFFYYRDVYRVKYLASIHGENPVGTYLENPSKYEPANPVYSFTNNRMAVDFGFPVNKFNDTIAMQAYVKQLKFELDFVIVVEYFDESLVMLKNLLNWSIKDILYIPRKFGKRTNNFIFSKIDEENCKIHSRLDYILYEAFLDVFVEKLKEVDSWIRDELHYFKSIRANVQNFCETTKTDMIVKVSQWNQKFIVSRRDCELMNMEAIPLINLVRNSYI